MKTQLLEILACPDCGGTISLTAGVPDAAGDIAEGTLSCQSCDTTFPIIGGVPRFVASERYAVNFGFEWNRFSETQLDHEADSDQRHRIYGIRDVRFGEESLETFQLKSGFTEDALRGKLVLDAGCGMGRFSDVCSRMGATVVGVDLSTSVEAAQRNIGNRPNVSILQADLHKLPFRQGVFDAVFSIGVLHHTPNTKQATLGLLPFVKPQGRTSIWVYSKRASWRGIKLSGIDFLVDLLRGVTRRLPATTLLRLCQWRIKLYPLESRFFPLRLLLSLTVPASQNIDPEWRLLDTFDLYSPWYRWRHTEDEVTAWFSEAGFQEITRLQVPVSVTAVKP